MDVFRCLVGAALCAGCTPLAAPVLGVDAIVPPENHAEISAGVVAGTDKLTGIFAQGDFTVSKRVAVAGGLGADTKGGGALTRALIRVRISDDRSPIAMALIAGPSANLWTDTTGTLNPRTTLEALPGIQAGFATTLGREGWHLGVGGLAVATTRGAPQFLGSFQGRTPLGEYFFIAGELNALVIPSDSSTDIYQGAMIRVGGRFRFRPDPPVPPPPPRSRLDYEPSEPF